MPQNTNTTPQGCGPQDVLDLSACPIDYAEANRRLASFRQRFRNMDYPSVSLAHMETIPYDQVDGLITGFKSDTAPCTGYYFRALVISYGLKDNKMINIYQPAIMNTSSAASTDYSVTKGPRYIYDGGFVADTAIDQYIAGYREKMEIQRRGDDPTFTPFLSNAGDTVQDNARSILYPQQEITAVWTENDEPVNIYFHTAARVDLETAPANIYKQEVLIAAVSGFADVPKEQGFRKGAGNLGHLCPPHCASVKVAK